MPFTHFCPHCAQATTGPCRCEQQHDGPLAGKSVPIRLRKGTCKVCGDPTYADRGGVRKLCGARQCTTAYYSKGGEGYRHRENRPKPTTRNLHPQALAMGLTHNPQPKATP